MSEPIMREKYSLFTGKSEKTIEIPIEELDSLRTRIAQLEEALKFYGSQWFTNADGDLSESHLTRTWQEPTEKLIMDAGQKAREALHPTPEPKSEQEKS